MAAMANPISTGRAGRARGFTYLGLIILLAVLGLVAAAGIKMGTVMQRAAAEEELLEIGAQFSAALRSYAAATPRGQPQQPRTLQELLRDPRFPNPRRHLRKIFVDPITGRAEWGVFNLNGDHGVIAVYSLSERRPLKLANFDARFPNFENREKLSEWKFTMANGGLQAPPPPLLANPTGEKPAPPSLFGQRPPIGNAMPVRAPPSQPMTPPVQEAAEPAPAPGEDKPMEPKPEEEDKDEDQDKDQNKDQNKDSENKPVAPPDDGRIDETRKDGGRREPTRDDPRVPVKKPPLRR